jgi:gamma-glutamylcysteine synthetase
VLLKETFPVYAYYYDEQTKENEDESLCDIAPCNIVGVDASEIRTDTIFMMITLMMDAVHTSETSVYFNETIRRYISQGCHLHTRHRGNLKAHSGG